jgi:hypothetical protein
MKKNKTRNINPKPGYLFSRRRVGEKEKNEDDYEKEENPTREPVFLLSPL